MTQGIIFYCDGSARPTNPGYNGWGVHGYLYEDEEPKKGSGNPLHILTNDGYLPKGTKLSDTIKEVKPVKYFDFFGSSLELNSNNVAEVDAARNSIAKSLEYDVKSVLIYTDSEYTRRGVEEWGETWIKNNWFRRDGTPVPNAEHWKKLFIVLHQSRDKGVDVKIKWVRGHNDDLGNTIADKLANVGSEHSIRIVLRNQFKVSEPEGYWKKESDKHPFFSNKRMYFNTTPDSQVVGEYLLGDHGKDDELIGAKSSDGAYSIVQLTKPDEHLELLRQYQSKIANGSDFIVMARLDKLFNGDVFHDIKDFGSFSLLRSNKFQISLDCLDKKPITKEIQPARLAMRAVESLTYLKGILNWFQFDENNTCIPETASEKYKKTDITNIFFNAETKVKKKGIEETVFKLKPEFIVGFESLEVKTSMIKDDKPIELSLSITLGMDIPDRNSLKRMESMQPKIYLITWTESPNVLRYATVIKAQESYGIWAGLYTNTVFF